MTLTCKIAGTFAELSAGLKGSYDSQVKLEIKEPRNVICHAAVQPGASVLGFMLIMPFLKQRQSVMGYFQSFADDFKKRNKID